VTTTTKRAGIVARVSLDRDGESESPDQQLGDGHGLADQRGWQVVQTYVERDVSGYKRDVKRPQYDRLVRDMKAGKLDVVVVWAIDRLTRQGVIGISKFMDVMEQTGVELVSVTQPFLDTTTPLGRGVLALIASLAEQESANISARVKRSHRYQAANGKRHTGGWRTFGYSCPGVDPEGCTVEGCPHDGESVIEAEAVIIKEAAQRVLGGESLWSICTDLNARGVKTTAVGKVRRVRDAPPDPVTGEYPSYTVTGEWQSRTLSALLRNPVLAGVVQHNGDRHPGTWEAVISENEHDAVVQALTTRPATRKLGDRHLLTGLVRCGLCDNPLKYMVMKNNTNGTKFPRYQCVKQPGHQHCGGIAVTMRSTDEHVARELVDFLAAVRLRPLDHEDDVGDLERQLTDAQERLTALVQARFVHGTLSADDYETARVHLQELIETTELRLTAARKSQDAQAAGLPLGDRAALAAWWEAADVEDRRTALRQAFSRVTIHPAQRRGGNKFDASRVDIRWNWDRFIRRAERATPTEADEAADRDERFIEGIYAEGVEQLEAERAG